MPFRNLLILVPAILAQTQLSDCSKGTSLFTYETATLEPSPVVPGENTSLSISLSIPQGTTIDAGTSTYSINVNGIPLPATKTDLCSEVTCPLVGGLYSNTTVSVFPSGLSGKITTKMQWSDLQNVVLYCLQIVFRL
jgi:hypothetical protein